MESRSKWTPAYAGVTKIVADQSFPWWISATCWIRLWSADGECQYRYDPQFRPWGTHMNRRFFRTGLGVALLAAGFGHCASASEGAWLRIESSRADLSRITALPGETIDYGRFQWIAAAAVNEAALHTAGIRTTRIESPFVLDLGGQRFDPLRDRVAATPPKAGGSEPDFRLVQFHGPLKPEWLTHLRAAGIEPVQYIHPYTYVVWSSAANLHQASLNSEVRWTGDFQTAFRLPAGQRHLDASLRRSMALVSRLRDQAELETEFHSLGAVLRSSSPLDSRLNVIELEAPGNRLAELAALRGVYTLQVIPSGGGPRGEVSNQSIVGGYDPAPPNTIIPGYQTWLDSLGFDGNGVVVSVVDGGIRTTHLDVASRMLACVPSGASPTSCTSSIDSHGTHVAAAIAGTGESGVLRNGFLRGKGVAPGANIVRQVYDNFLGGGPGQMIADGMLKIYKESALSGAVLTNNSWGPTGSPQGYDIPTQQVDMVIRDANPDEAGNQQIQNVWSIMNGGGDGFGACAPSSLGSPDEAKNLFAVGSTSLQNGSGAQVGQIFNISSNSAHGNACDGRRVPSIVAPGCNTESATASSDTSFGYMCGTSMASPVVSGASALFVEKYRSEHADATPSPALIKAVFTAVAKDLHGFNNADGAVMGHRPDRFQGYGRIDLDAVVNSQDPVFSIDQGVLLDTTGASWNKTVVAADPARPVRIMLAWTDAKGHGLGGSTPAWVNDLDLSVAVDATTYLGNVIGGDGWSASGGSADNKNNLEGIFLSPDQLTGSIEITVLAANIAADALNPYTPGAPAQDFALVCYNCVEAPLPDLIFTDGFEAGPTP
jgi:serine protease AprX